MNSQSQQKLVNLPKIIHLYVPTCIA